jgi:predicted DNA-binding protein
MKTTNVRLPDGLHERLKEAAERNRRTLNSQIVWYLEQGLDSDDRPDSPTP